MMKRTFLHALPAPLLAAMTTAAFSLAVAACSSNGTSSGSDGGNGEDATADSGSGSDSSTTPEAGGNDSSMAVDTGTTQEDSGTTTTDSGTPGTDSGTIVDSGTAMDSTAPVDSGSPMDASDGSTGPTQVLETVSASAAVAVVINQGTAIGQGAGNGATPSTLANVAADPKNTQTGTTGSPPFLASGTVPDTAAGYCSYPSGGSPTRDSYVTGTKFETCNPDGGGTDPMVPMAPFYFPLVYTSAVTTTAHGCNVVPGAAPIVGLFDWRPKDIDEGLVVAESDDWGQTWYFMQTVLELNPDYTNPISGGYGRNTTAGEPTGCPATVTGTNANYATINGTTADDGWGHASIIQLPGAGNAATGGQFLYMLDRNTANMPGTSNSYVDNAPLNVIQLDNSTQKFPIANTNNTNPGANDIKSIWSALNPTPDAGTNEVTVQQTVGLLNPDGIMAVFPTASTAAAGSPVTVMYVQKILNGDNTGATALPASQRCNAAPFSGKTNDDISNVRLATTTDGIHFTDLGIVEGLNDPTTVDYNGTRWISPRGTLIDVNGDGSVWGLFFSGGNCLDGDSDAFHYIGYAESTDKMHWTVFNDINHPIASTNPQTHPNQAGGAMVTIPANPPLVATEYWFAERLYAPTAVQIDSTHLSVTFAGYGVQTPNKDLLDYRQIGNVVLTLSKALPAGTPNNINAH
jgi:hypothetical protein